MEFYRPQRNYGCRIHDKYSYFGMRVVVVENEKVRISILADKGTEIFEYAYKPMDLDFMWLSANGVQNPNQYLPTSPDPISSFIDYYPGGWQEVFPNGGPTSRYKDAEYGQHGEVAHMPWDYAIEEDTDERVVVRFRVRTKKAPYELTKRMTLSKGSTALVIDETLENLSEEPMRFMWGHHLAYGRPFVGEGCKIILPERLKVKTGNGNEEFDWPIRTDASGDTHDFSVLPERNFPSNVFTIYGFDQQAWYRVENEALRAGMKVEWDGAVFPYLWYWQEFGATREYPWYGRHYNIGLEPFSGYPTSGLEEAVRNGSAGSIGPGEKLQFRIVTQPYEL